MNERHWKVDVELIFPVLPGELTVHVSGDTEVDCGNSVIDERLRPALETLLSTLGVGAHYYIGKFSSIKHRYFF